MDYTLKELLDIPRLHELLDLLDEIHSMPSAIVDIEGNILTTTTWQGICAKFHRVNPETAPMCLESKRHIGARLAAHDPQVVYRCPLGLVDAAMPIIIEGEHLGNVFTGQFFTEPPDEAYFMNQARQYGFDESDYLVSMREVPLFAEERFRKNLTFIHSLTQMLAEQGLQSKRQSAAEEALRNQNNEYALSQKQLKESEERFRALHDATFGGVIIHDQGLILDCNQGLSDMTGFTNKELIGMNGFKLIAPDSLELVLHNIKSGYAKRYEVEGLRKDGSVYPLAIRGKNIPYQGREVRVIEFRDISERKQAENDLKAERFRLSEVIRGTNVGTWEWNIQTGENIANERWAEILGYSLQDFPAFSIDVLLALIHPDDLKKRNAQLEKHFSGEFDFYEAEFRMKHRGGRWIWVLARGKVSSWTAAGRPLLMFGSLADIDDRKRQEEERQTLEKLNSVGTLAGGIAHDFNNILAGLYGNISLARRKLEKEHPGYRFLSAAEKSINRAALLTNQLLTFAKGGEPVTESLSLQDLIEEVVPFNLTGSNVKPVITHAAKLWSAKADQGQMQQVIGNLTINAKQSMPDGGHLYIAIENFEVSDNNLLGLEEGRYLRLSVTDEGTGIDPEYLDRIFEPYFTTKQTGRGLGLATIYSIIKKHAGRISVHSQLGQGTTFTLYLPASESMELPHKQAEAELLAREQAARILIMDDEEQIRNVLTAMLEELNFRVEAASGGQQAVELYQQAMAAGEPFDLVILDLTIPGEVGGLDVAGNILKLDAEARLIVSSGYADNPVMANYAAYGFTGVMAKPYTLNKISAVLTQILGGSVAPD